MAKYLTQQQCLDYHRELWDWLAKHPLSTKSQWPGWKRKEIIEASAHLGGDLWRSECFCCYIWKKSKKHLSLFKIKDNTCRNTGSMMKCLNGVYNKWTHSISSIERKKIALQIRDWPSRNKRLVIKELAK